MTPSEQIAALLRVDENGLLPEAIYAGRLPTLSNDVYPGLGSWWVQLRTTDIIHARVFANSPEEAHEKAELLSAAWNIRPAMRQMVKDIQELRRLLLEPTGESWATVEKTCPKCCPNGDDPDWSAFGNKEGAVCAYSECGHPLTVIDLEQKRIEILTATAHYENLKI